MYNNRLETFIKVADAGSFSKASQAMYVSTTAVIKQINLLEEDLALQLFVRSHRGLALTDAGKSLYQDAKYIIQYAQDSLARARQAMKTADADTIRVGTSLMTPSDFLVELWPRIREYCPELKLQLVPYENTPENAREILLNLGQNIDIVAGIFDEQMLSYRKCAAFELSREPICLAVSIHHSLAKKDRLAVEDLYGETLMLIEREKFLYIDILRDALMRRHPKIGIADFPFYNLGVFNQCENSNQSLIAVGYWTNVHPLLKIMPVDWDFTIPFGIMHAPEPSATVSHFLSAVKKVMRLKNETPPVTI